MFKNHYLEAWVPILQESPVESEAVNHQPLRQPFFDWRGEKKTRAPLFTQLEKVVE